ncbi:hypothetical protein M5K25_012382 [Dendrobium thyrsiflorum]|uniref:RIN4 pathogenic type III effector avirulence factor Avr cleavage site domain-containing protein n=1 Tax=Dendrobium thyrsiflorum TaxID=117978 RepID=A0ABD0UWU9_DENTH
MQLPFCCSQLLAICTISHYGGWEQDKGQPLPKFGEWDVNNPASAEGFTVIFNKARDERKGNANPGAVPAPPRNNIGAYKLEDGHDFPRKNSKWFCCA